MSDGTSVEGQSVDFTPVSEVWNSYKLPDGTIIKLKTIVVEIYRLESIEPATGQHNYFVKHNTVVSALEPERKV